MTIMNDVMRGLRFARVEVLKTVQEIISRKRELEKAVWLGNVFRNKVKLFFKANNEEKVLETTVWGLTDESVIIKGGAIIPINSIYRVNVY